MKSPLITALLCTLAVSVQARIGENFQQLTNRYGKPITSDFNGGSPIHTFQFQKYKIAVTLHAGRSVTEVILSPDAELAEEKALALASMIVGNPQTQWVKEKKLDPTEIVFTSSPDRYVASYKPLMNGVLVTTREELNRPDRKKTPAELAPRF